MRVAVSEAEKDHDRYSTVRHVVSDLRCCPSYGERGTPSQTPLPSAAVAQIGTAFLPPRRRPPVILPYLARLQGARQNDKAEALRGHPIRHGSNARVREAVGVTRTRTASRQRRALILIEHWTALPSLVMPVKQHRETGVNG
jgi:hypothetical protein